MNWDVTNHKSKFCVTQCGLVQGLYKAVNPLVAYLQKACFLNGQVKQIYNVVLCNSQDFDLFTNANGYTVHIKQICNKI